MGLLILLALGLLLAWASMVLYTAWVLIHPARRTYGFAVARNLPGDPSELLVGDPPTRGLAFASWTFRSRSRDLPVWDVQGLSPSGPTIILTHGWGDSRVMMLSRLAGLAPLAARLILWDLPAHGDSPPGGFTLRAREHEDLIALIDTLTTDGATDRAAERSVPGASRLILYGASLGAGVSIVAAAARAARPRPALASPIAAVIAEAPYRIPRVPARNVLRVRGLPYRATLRPAMALLGLRFGYGLSWALSPTAGGFDTALHAARLPASVPLLVLHGSLDPISPPEDAQAIVAAAPKSTLAMIDGAGHNNLWTDPAFAAQCSAAVRSLLTRATNVAAPPS
ncbi:MAG TPA: alpha/beta hydrolase [Phycisphaerales bacterium]|nr:alpha/beta hydrolase [Phycisphaerales bacterium]